MSGSVACPQCHVWQTRTLDSRSNGYGIRRRRECANGHRFTTQEMVADFREMEEMFSQREVVDLRQLPPREREAFVTLFDLASGMEAREGQDAQRLDAKHDSPAPKGDAR